MSLVHYWRMHINDIEASAQRFRRALDEIHEHLGVPFDQFPRGCCGDTSELLAAFLTDAGLGIFRYVSGWREDGSTSHAWLEQEGVVVDVTADQFEDYIGRPFVTTDRTWHTQFLRRQDARENGDFREAGEPPHLVNAYAKLTKHLLRGYARRPCNHFDQTKF